MSASWRPTLSRGREEQQRPRSPKVRAQFGHKIGFSSLVSHSSECCNYLIYWRRAGDSNSHAPCDAVDFKSTALPVEASPPYPYDSDLRYTFPRSVPCRVRCGILTGYIYIRTDGCNHALDSGALAPYTPNLHHTAAARRCEAERRRHRSSQIPFEKAIARGGRTRGSAGSVVTNRVIVHPGPMV